MPRFTGKCAIEVHQMESRRALFLPEKCGSDRIVAVLRGASGVPFLEAHAFSALQVYCRNQFEIHSYTFIQSQSARKLRRSCLPASWLFSGWNCAPQTFPRRAMEQKRLP